MAESASGQPVQKGASRSAAEVSAAPAGAGGPSVDWRAIWPVPVLVVASGALLLGVVQGMLKAPKADPAAPLGEVRALMSEREYEKAIGVVNERLLPAIMVGAMPGAASGEALVLRARALLAGQAALGVRVAANDRAAIEDFRRAEEFGGPGALTDTDRAEVAEAYAALGETQKAVEAARALPASMAARARGVLRQVVDANLRRTDVRYDQTLSLLTELMEAEGTSVDDRAWVVARQSELRLAMNFDEEAITKLLVAIPRLEGLGAAPRGELLFLLGKGYFQAGQYEQAERQLGEARRLLGEHEAAHGEASVLIGRIMQAGGQLEAAREEFQRVSERHGSGLTGALARLGLAETRAAAGEEAASLEAYDGVIGFLLGAESAAGDAESAAGSGAVKAAKAPGRGSAPGEQRGLTVDMVSASLMDRYAERASAEAHGRALPFAGLARRLHQGAGRSTPAGVLLGIGASSRAEGVRILTEARTTEDGLLPLDQISPVTQAEAKRYLIEAGEAFREHAAAVVVADKPAYDDSTWNAADCFDLAGDREAAKQQFSSYIQSASGDDPRRPEARFRLAQILQAERDYAAAAAGYRQIIDAASASRSGGGPWVDAALVPLARCYLLDDQAGNDAEAEQLLMSALDGATIAPESDVYRAALVELGEMYLARGRHAESIARLDEAVTRYPDHERLAQLVFKLAEANRLSAGELSEELKQSKPQREREALTVLREQRLKRAGELYARTLAALAGKDRRKHSAMDRLAERNATFARGDVAFELGAYEEAIGLYDAARQSYSGDPASLVAMVQIVNSYVAMGRWSEAQTANERARQQLASLPEDVWKSPDLPMERKHWERWLDAGALLDRRLSASAGGE